MEALGVISKVDVPTDWCTGILIMPKKNGSVGICLNLKPLKCAPRDTSLPHVDETLAQLPSATVFSWLDSNSRFWQILQTIVTARHVNHTIVSVLL